MLEIQHLSSELVLYNINKGKFISQVLQEIKSLVSLLPLSAKPPVFKPWSYKYFKTYLDNFAHL